MSATLQDVARMAGVHASTVSRVLSGKASIRSETRDRIFAAIRQLDYHPNSNARSLAGGHTGVLALVLDMNRSDPYGGIFESDSQFSLEKEAYRRHCHMMLVSPDAVHELVKEQRIDGLLATPAAAKELALPKNFPCVLLGQPDQPNPNVSWVDNDLLLGAQMAVDHLCHQHYAAISFLGASCNGSGSLHRRLEGYRHFPSYRNASPCFPYRRYACRCPASHFRLSG
ncbi:MAG: LacI family DNA-binding transcriptional regulator [Lachnospiraceae bacterium]